MEKINFGAATNMKSLILPPTLRVIEDNAFSPSGLTTP
jgi:hypothetical protein